MKLNFASIVFASAAFLHAPNITANGSGTLVRYSENSAVLAELNSPITLQYSLKSGEKYIFSSRTSMKQSIGEMDMTTSIESGNDIILHIKEARNGTYKIETELSPVKISLSGLQHGGIPDTTMEVNLSDQTSEPVFADAHGIIKNDEKKAPPKKTEKNDKSMLANAAIKQSIKQSMKSILMTLPEKPLNIGDTWSRDEQAEGASESIHIKTSFIYTLDDVIDTLGKRCAVIAMKTKKLTMDGSMEQMGMKMNVDGDGSANGRILIEVENGMPLAGRIATQIEMRMAVSGQEQMIMPISTETVNVYARKLK